MMSRRLFGVACSVNEWKLRNSAIDVVDVLPDEYDALCDSFSLSGIKSSCYKVSSIGLSSAFFVFWLFLLRDWVVAVLALLWAVPPI